MSAQQTATLALLGVLTIAGCLGQREGPERRVETPTRPIADVLADHTRRLMAIDGVTAVGEGRLPDGRPCVRVYLLTDDPALRRRIPETLEGHPVVVEVSGEIRAMPEGSP